MNSVKITFSLYDWCIYGRNVTRYGKNDGVAHLLHNTVSPKMLCMWRHGRSFSSRVSKDQTVISDSSIHKGTWPQKPHSDPPLLRTVKTNCVFCVFHTTLPNLRIYRVGAVRGGTHHMDASPKCLCCCA